MEKFQIFISYRRSGGDILAGRIADRLLGLGYTVFYDVESMVSGLFNNQIYSAIESCQDVLVILPKDALQRCENENDWVRQEIAHAISLGKNIIPVMTNDFVFPDVLPSDIDALRNYEGVHVINEFFDALIKRICDLMQSQPQNKALINENLDNGIRFINNKLYSKAVEALEKALENDMSNPEIHFYLSVALLEGKRPFLSQKSKITRIEEHLGTAISIEEKAIYYYFLAYIKYDFYENKSFKSIPNSYELASKANALGLNSIEIDELFELLRVQRPNCF